MTENFYIFLKKMYNKLKSFQSSKQAILQLHLQLQKVLIFSVSAKFYEDNFFS